MEETGFYVYGIVDKVIDENAIDDIMGIDGKHRLMAIKEDDIYAAASPVGLDEYGEGRIDALLEDMVWVEGSARKHFDIQQALFSMGTLIPVKFCTIYTDESNIREYIRTNSADLHHSFSYFSDKDEWTFKAYCDKKRFIEMNMEEERQKLHEQTGSTSKGMSYFLAKKLESSLDVLAKDKLIRIRDDIWEHLKIFIEDAVINKNLCRQVTGFNEDMILNASLLVSKEKTGNLAAECRLLEEKLNNLNIYFELTGPWPVYNFSGK